MSGRIRSIKPEWIDSESFCACSDAAIRLSFVFYALVDDDGRVRISVRALGMRAWGFCDAVTDKTAHARAALDELVRVGWLEEYEVDGVACWQVRNWAKHQKIDKHRPSKLPAPPSREESRGVANGREESRGVANGREESRGVANGREESSNSEKLNDSVSSRKVARSREDSRGVDDTSRGVATDLDLDLDLDPGSKRERARARTHEAVETMAPIAPSEPGAVARPLLISGFRSRYEAAMRQPWIGHRHDPEPTRIAAWFESVAAAHQAPVQDVIDHALNQWFSETWPREHGFPWRIFCRQVDRYFGPAPEPDAAAVC